MKTYVFTAPGAKNIVKLSSTILRENSNHFVFELNHQKNTIAIIFKKEYITVLLQNLVQKLSM